MKKLAFATLALIAAGFVTEAGAANAIYFTGSTAFRGNAYNVLSASTTGGGVWDATPDVATRGNATASKGSDMLFHGNISGVETFISCHWSGSEAGLASVANTTVPNPPNGNIPGAPATFLKTDGSVAYTQVSSGATGSELEATTRQGDLALADTSSAVSLTSTYPFASFGTVGIVPFTWMKNTNSTPNASWSALSNITHDQARVLLTFPQPAAFFTGNPAHTSYVYPVGRNKGSGTRVNTLADVGYGITTPVVQFSIGGLPFTGGLTLNEEDNNGYESGGDVAKALGVDGSCQQTDPNFGGTGWLAVGYLGTSDAAALAVSPYWLTLNGVLESDGAVEEGQYSFWGNEHLYGQSDVISNAAKQYQEDFANLFKTKIGNNLGGGTASAHSSGIQVGFMHAEKLADTAAPTRK
ncbi:MAG TPA: hypothetical protein VG938_04235 [Verrucomicrobiae bacterium]|jgi:hypothetical protein|nr:hypothetical protein [Verrucomicrobiae bacterium]